MKLELAGKRALVTASTGGIGRAIARALADEGATVVMNGRSKQTVEAAADAIRGGDANAEIEVLVADISTRKGCDEAVQRYPHVDILVNNLGIYEAADFFEQSDADWERLFQTNVMSGVRLSRHYLRSMLEAGHGRVVFIASEAALAPAPEMAHYSATKAMQISLSRSLAELTRGTGVTVNSVLPGSTRTDGVRRFVQSLFPDLPYEEAEARFMHEQRPSSLIERLIDPHEIAALVAFVCSSRSSAINGAALRSDGGIVRHIT